MRSKSGFTSPGTIQPQPIGWWTASQTRSICAQQPRLGRTAEELLPGLRVFPVGNYLIFYRPHDDGVFVVRILHGARNITPELFE